MNVIAGGSSTKTKLVIINNPQGNEIMIGENLNGDFIITQNIEGEEIAVGYIQPTSNDEKKDRYMSLRTLVHEREADTIQLSQSFRYSVEAPLDDLKETMIAMYTDTTFKPKDFLKKFYKRVAVVDAVTLLPVITIYDDKEDLG
ncbi:MAG: hypothetical protein EGP82_03395 [Odoribacter splanchnicus]|nr:hypothetical protein [Odoribacter splanchnicus]